MYEVISNARDGSGDWVIIKKDGEVVHSGHNVPLNVVVALLNAKETQVTDKEMESLC